MQTATPEKRTTTTLIITAIAAVSILTLLLLSHSPPPPPTPSRLPFPHPSPTPSLAYLISSSSPNSIPQLLRLLSAVYHPNNYYLLHLHKSVPDEERRELVRRVEKERVYREVGNVDVIGKADFAYRRGGSSLAARLHGASVLLRIAKKWDWFVSLDVDDYPLVTQDDLLHILSYLPKELNFVNHTSYFGWKESRSLKRIIIDPGLYLSDTSWMFFATQKRDLPNAFRLFSGVQCYVDLL